MDGSRSGSRRAISPKTINEVFERQRAALRKLLTATQDYDVVLGWRR